MNLTDKHKANANKKKINSLSQLWTQPTKKIIIKYVHIAKPKDKYIIQKILVQSVSEIAIKQSIKMMRVEQKQNV